jgi:phosphoglycerate dehydrogenase-like enzyme
MKYSIAVPENIHLLAETEEKIKSLATNNVVFPKDSQVSEEELIKRTGDAEVILVSPWTKITKSYLASCPTIKYIGLCGTSTANIDLEAVKAKNIMWTNVKDYGDETAAEFFFMRLTALTRGIGMYQWKEMPHELMGLSFGVIGLGALGKAIAHLALAYKMDAKYFSTHRKDDWEARGLIFADIPSLVQSSDIVVLSTPTHVQVLGEKEFSLMKPDSILVQASIGVSFDENAFLDWIKKDNHYAIFDGGVGEVHYQKFKDIPRVLTSTVAAGHSYESRRRLGDRVIENLENFTM